MLQWTLVHYGYDAHYIFTLCILATIWNNREIPGHIYFPRESAISMQAPSFLPILNCHCYYIKIGTFRGTCVYCAIFIGIIRCTRASPPHAHWNEHVLWARTEFHFEYYMAANASQTCKRVTWHDTQNLVKTKQIAKSTLKSKWTACYWKLSK